MKKLLISIFLLMITISIILIVFNEKAVVEKDSIEVFSIQKRNEPETVRATGILIPEKQVDLKSNRSGIIKEAIGLEGDRVSSADLLYSYDDDIAKAELNQAEANLLQAESSLEQAEARKREAEAAVELANIKIANIQSADHNIVKTEIDELELKIKDAEKKVERNKKLYNNNAIEQVKYEDSVYNLELLYLQKDRLNNKLNDLIKEKNNKLSEARQSLNQSKMALRTAEKNIAVSSSAVKVARAAVNKAEISLEKYKVQSPITGIILSKHIEDGEFVQAGQLLYSLSSNNFLVRISPDERELKLLSVGKEGYISPDAYPEKKLMVKISRVSPSIDVDRGTVDIYLELLENTDILMANMSVSVEIIVKDNDKQIYIPEKYIFENGEQQYVFVYQQGRAVKRIISTGNNNQGMLAISKGLKEDDIVIYSSNISNGMEIELER